MTDDQLYVLQLLNRYGVAVDSQQWDLFDEIFTEDVVAEYDAPTVLRGLAAFKAGAAQAWGTFDASQHAMSNTVWDLKERSGRTLTYGTWCIIRRGVPGGDLWEGKGWYDDEWVRLDVGWRIRRRSCRVIWWSGNPNVMAPNPGIDVQIKVSSLKDAVRDGTLGFFKT